MIRNIFLLVLSALCAWSCTALDDAIVPGPATEPQPADAPHSLRITVAPKPAFAEAAINMPDGIPPAPDTHRADGRGDEVGRGGLGVAVCGVLLYKHPVPPPLFRPEIHRHHVALPHRDRSQQFRVEVLPYHLQPHPYLRPSRRKHPICGGIHPRLLRGQQQTGRERVNHYPGSR